VEGYGAEIANIIFVAFNRRKRINQKQIDEYLMRLKALPIRVELNDVWANIALESQARKWNLPAYDAAYLGRDPESEIAESRGRRSSRRKILDQSVVSTMKLQDNRDLLRAFPSSVRNDVSAVVSVLPENPHGVGHFQVQVDRETIEIPNRVYHNPVLIDVGKLSDFQRHLVDCILTRHNDGHVRQTYLDKIIDSNKPWVPAYVIQLLGEYVVEMQQLIAAKLQGLDKDLYRNFLAANLEFLAFTELRVISYWNCYYRNQIREKYAGFCVLNFFKELIGQKT
jgi:hypothetical protein